MADYGVPPNPPYVERVIIGANDTVAFFYANSCRMLICAMPASKNSSPSIVKP